jgi:hypothetical protein
MDAGQPTPLDGRPPGYPISAPMDYNVIAETFRLSRPDADAERDRKQSDQCESGRLRIASSIDC